MFAICENKFNRFCFIEKEGQPKTPLSIAISIIVALGGLFVILACYQILPYGANCISDLGTGGLVLGWGLSGVGTASSMYNIKKFCSPHPMHTQNLKQKNNTINTDSPAIASQANKAVEKSNHTEDWIMNSWAFNSDLQGSKGSLTPNDHPFSDLFSKCRNPNVCFLSVCLSVGNQFSLPIQQLKEAFAQGKQMVFVILGTGRHAFGLGCCVDGSFKIIDPMFDNSVGCEKVTNALNQADIKNFYGKQIHFFGEYVNTHIQPEGNDCIKFTTLYCYHMGERQDLEAYQEVNGAFLDGLLVCFEDYKKISGARKIRSLEGKSYTYESFMLSWRYRMLGWRVDTWEEFSLQEIFTKLDRSDMNTHTNTCVALVSKGKSMPYFLCLKERERISFLYKLFLKKKQFVQKICRIC